MQMTNVKHIGASLLAVTGGTALAHDVPPCRLDQGAVEVVQQTLGRATKTYRELGKALPFDRVVVNPQSQQREGRTLHVLVVSEAAKDGVDNKGCPRREVAKDDQLDPLSVSGGCFVSGDDPLELRCSARAVKLFSEAGNKPGRANPALLYVLAHELGHVHQREVGEYEGRAERVALGSTRADKLKALKNSCSPASTTKEAKADELALTVLERLLPLAPYAEPIFTPRGSVLWNVDQIVLAANEWQRLSFEQEFISRPPVHKSFVPIEFPTPTSTVNANAHQFVCDVLTGTRGYVYHPLQSTSHPPLDQRMRRVAEVIKPVADRLPNEAGKAVFEPVARLQSQLSPIFTHIYRETGVFMEAVHNAVCTIVNDPNPPTCR